ncbi:MAG: methionyl-tRNA formyltransferase [Acidimicrobiales bacterium]
MRLADLGTPDAAVAPLRGLVAAGHDVEVVVSRADKRRGRGSGLVASPVKAAALEMGLPVTTDVDDLLGRGLDLGVVVAFGRIIRPHVLTELPMVNLHFSLLPRWRGAAPVERAVLAGDTETGVCLMEVAEGLDEGGVFAVERTPVDPEETVDELRSRLVGIGTRLVVDGLGNGLGAPAPQEGEVSYAAKVAPDELRLDWTEPAGRCHARVRLGRAWTQLRGGRLLITRATKTGGPAGPVGTVDAELAVACGDGQRLRLLEVQPAGRGPMAAAAWANGARPVGQRLG